MNIERFVFSSIFGNDNTKVFVNIIPSQFYGYDIFVQVSKIKATEHDLVFN